jgi:hypothetical protein
MAITALAAIIALAVLRDTRRSPVADRMTSPGTLAACLSAVADALVVVGLVSHTLLRHLIQVAPVLVAGILLPRQCRWGAIAAAPLFAFWFLVMGAIWLFLLGLASIVSGTFTSAEVTLTVIIGAASLLGLVTVHRQSAAAPLAPRLGTIAVFAVLQFAAMWLSVQPFAAAR